MKKLLAVAMILCLFLTAACGKNKSAQPASESGRPAEQQQGQQAGQQDQKAGQQDQKADKKTASQGNEIAGVRLVKNQPQPKFRDDLPAELKEYVGPTELSMDYTQPEFQLFGYVYRLPVPVEVFIMNGWKMDQEMPVTKGFIELVRFEKNGFSMDCMVANYNGQKDMPVKDCVVIMLNILSFGAADSEDNICQFLYAGGIAPGMTAKQILAIAKDAKAAPDGQVEYNDPNSLQSNGFRMDFDEQNKMDNFYVEWHGDFAKK